MPVSRAAACLCAVAALAILAGASAPSSASELLFGTEGNRLRRYDVDTIGSGRLLEEVLIERASSGEFGSPSGPGRDLNGQICFFPDGSGRFLAGEDTGQPTPRAGWGIFDESGEQVGKLTATYQVAGAEPFGCAFDPATGILFTTSVGAQGFGAGSGQLIMWFPPYEGFPGAPGEFPDADPTSDNFCKLAVDLGTAGSVVVDPDGRVLVAQSGALRVTRFNPPFPTGPDAAGGCGAVDPQGSPFISPSLVQRDAGEAPFREESLLEPGGQMVTPAGLAISPSGRLIASSVLTGALNEYDLETGAFLRQLIPVAPPISLPTAFGNPQGIAIGADGTLYYADLDLQGSIADASSIRPGPDGKVRRVRFDPNGEPLPPEVVRAGLSFPDGVALLPGNLERAEWLTLAGGPERRFHQPAESILDETNVALLSERWRLTVPAVITVSPSVALVDLPGEGLTRLVFFQAWDLMIYAVRVADGSVVWRFETEDQPGSSFPSTASIHVEKIDDLDRVFVGQGHNFYSLDARTGEELWRFTAGTGCGYDTGDPPGECGFGGERNQIESTAIVADGRVFFGMDVNDVSTGKGGFFALDARDGRLAWFFDLESGQTCRPDAGEVIRRYDGYHAESELGLPSGFFQTRSGCDHPRTRSGCGNVWSSPAVDFGRGALFIASSNCDTAFDPGLGRPADMPPFDEAVFSLDFDGNVRWAWRPRAFDVDDLAFGGVPNLFEIETSVGTVEVVGVGSKDGTYYVLDRDGQNQVTGARFDDAPETHLPAGLPYWRTQVVDGGSIGGIIATAAVDAANRRVFFSTAPGESGVNTPPAPPQTPTVHALDLDTGAVVWDNQSETPALASFSSTLHIPGVVFAGSAAGAILRAYRDTDGAFLGEQNLANLGMGSTPIVVDGTLLVGDGIGTRTSTGSSISDIISNSPSKLNALCVPGTAGCAACDDGVDNDGDGAIDDADPGCLVPGDLSEVLGDIDGDQRVDARDERSFLGAFGRRPAEPGYRLGADLDPPGDPDGVVGLVDYQRWLAAREEYEANLAPPARACGLLGVEPLVVLLLGSARRRVRRARRATRGQAAALGLLLATALVSEPGEALTSLRLAVDGAPVSGSEILIDPGEDVGITIRGSIGPEALIGFGLDLLFDPILLSAAPATVGPDWIQVAAADGDGLAGLATPPGVSGADVVFARIVLSGVERGRSTLALAVSPDDPTEGFALLGVGAFDLVDFGSPLTLRVPEPGGVGLLLGALALVAAARRS
ncbi:MAG: PQQ-binding-like beta-propeller repeat protein [Myxococcota bacterium]|nr:PQQ-binding-like beta-propeller repeat protein [Myxococcota bacterium]